MEKKWECWVLSEEDIKDKCMGVGLDYNKLSKHQVEEIARRFRKRIEDCCDDWSYFLADIINEVR